MAGTETPVAVIGAGPTGLTLALLLARAGIRSTLVESALAPQPHPAACILNARTLEVFREIGVADDILEHCQHVLERSNITWVTSLSGIELGRCSVAPDDIDRVLALSAGHTTLYPQNRFEPLLWRQAQANPLIEFLTGHECVAARESNGGVTCTLKSPSGSHRLDARYAIGCDGAGSAIRRLIDVRFDGDILQQMIGIYFTADLGELVSHRKSILYWVNNSHVLGVLIAHWLPHEWVLYAPYFPPQQSPADFDEQRCTRLVTAAIGAPAPDLDIMLVQPWAIMAKLASSYRRGRIFLAGDAAHAMPPTGGFGLNTGVQDSHNLAWKLAAVLSGAAGPALLDSYQCERRPVARTNIEHSVRNYEQTSDLLRVVGLDLRHLSALRAVQNATLFAALPSSWQNGIVAFAMRRALGRLNLLTSGSVRGARARKEFKRRIPDQAPHYRFLGLDLGFTYGEGAFIAEATPKPEPADPVLDYRPTTWPSARLPHVMVERNRRAVSIHDVLAPDAFTLLIRADGSKAWRTAVAEIKDAFAMPVRCFCVGPAEDADLVDREDAWAGLCETGPTGAVLVRPDGHVAWRVHELPERPAEDLKSVINQILCLG